MFRLNRQNLEFNDVINAVDRNFVAVVGDVVVDDTDVDGVAVYDVVTDNVITVDNNVVIDDIIIVDVDIIVDDIVVNDVVVVDDVDVFDDVVVVEVVDEEVDDNEALSIKKNYFNTIISFFCVKLFLLN